MNELNRNMLRISGIGSAAKSQQAAAAQKTFRHLATGFRQTRRFAGKEMLEQLVPLEQAFFNPAHKIAGCRHRVCL
jgi:hypothetical protein